MSIDNWIMIASAALIALGWWVTGHLERKNEIAKERREYRINMLLSFLPVLFFVQKNSKITGTKTEELQRLLEQARTKFLLYGYEDEIRAYESLVAAFCSNDSTTTIDRLNKLADIVRLRIRTELGLPRHTRSEAQECISSSSEGTQ